MNFFEQRDKELMGVQNLIIPVVQIMCSYIVD